MKKRRHRFDDLSTAGIMERHQRPESGWRGLLQVRRSDMNRLLLSLPIMLPLLAGLMVLALSAVTMRMYHQEAEAALALKAEGYALGMDRFLNRLKDEAVAASASGAEEAAAPAANATLIRLGPLGIADRDNRALDELRHIERDMLRRSLSQDGPVLDAYREGKVWEISIAQPVAGVGVLLVSYPEQVFQRELGRLSGSGGEVGLALRFNILGNWYTVAARGDVSASAENSVRVQAPLSDATWAVQVSMGEWAYDRWIYRNLWLYAVTLVAFAAVFLQFVLALHRLRLRRLALRRNAARSAADSASADDREQDLIASAFSRAAAAGSIAPNSEQTDDPASQTSGAEADDAAEPYDEDDDFLDVLAEPESDAPAPVSVSLEEVAPDFEADVFRAYDIRGIADTQLTPDLCRNIGLAIGAELKQRKQSRVLVARDGRNSSPRIRDALVEGLLNSGIDVTDLGAVPTPLMHFATHDLGVGNGLMITGSHNGRDCNGVKLVMEGQSLTEEGIHSLRDRISAQRFVAADGQRGRYDNKSIADAYVERVCADVVVARRLKVVVDAANGITGPIAPRVYQALGCSVEPLYCELDGDFPNHDPDPTRPGNLHALQAAVRAKRADIGIAFDGDGDRVVFVTSTGDMVYPDQALMILAQDVVARNPGATIVYDVKCSGKLQHVVSDAGGIPVMCRSGHSYVKRQVEESQAQLGGEFTGHIFLRERWYGFDDGIYVGARMLELLSLSPKKLHQMIELLPESVATPELLVDTDDRQKFVIMEQLKAGDYFANAQLNMLDGIRAEFPFGWGLVRASNTGPALSLRFEADSEDNLAKIQAYFRRALSNVDPTLTLGF